MTVVGVDPPLIGQIDDIEQGCFDHPADLFGGDQGLFEPAG